jgi:hypothetical protein
VDSPPLFKKPLGYTKLRGHEERTNRVIYTLRPIVGSLEKKLALRNFVTVEMQSHIFIFYKKNILLVFKSLNEVI